MIKIIAVNDDEKPDKKQEKQDVKKVKNTAPSKPATKSAPEESKVKLNPQNYFSINPNFKFYGFIDDLPNREFTIKEPGKKGLMNFIKENIFALKNRKAPIVVARIDGNLLSVNPNPPIQKSYNTSVNPRGFMLGIIDALGKIGIKCNEFVSLYSFARGKLNKVVGDILGKHVTTENFEISKIEGVENLSDVLNTLNSSNELQLAMQSILKSYNTYVDMYGRYLLKLVDSKIKG